MPAPSNLRQVTQIGPEATYGAGATPTKVFGSFGLGRERPMEVSNAVPRGAMFATKSWINSEASTYSIENGFLSYDDTVYVAQSAIKKVTPTTPAGGTNSRQWEYSASQWSSDAFQSYAVEVGDVTANRGGRANGVNFTGLGFTVSSTGDSVPLTGDAIGWKVGTTGMTAGLAAADYQIAIPRHFKLYYATTFANLAVPANRTEISEGFSAGFSIGDRRNQVRYIGKPDGGPSDTVDTIPSTEFPMTVADTATVVDPLISAAEAGNPVFFRLEATGPQIEMSTDVTPVPIFHRITADMCCILSDGPGDGEESDVKVRNFTYRYAQDPVANKAFNLRFVNKLAAAS